MKLPSHVNEAKAHLEKTNDNRLKIMRTLTESEDLAYEEYYEEMWKSVFRAEKKYSSSDSEWVLLFLNSVMVAMEEKPYYSLNREGREQLLRDIKNHTRELKKIYQDSGLDQPFLSYDPQFLNLFDDDGSLITEGDLLPSIGITDALNFYEDFANEEIKGFLQKGKLVKRYRSNRFIRELGKRNLSRYGQPLLNALRHSAFAIYGDLYSEPDVHTLIYGR